jgi:toxin ParE1/3/4
MSYRVIWSNQSENQLDSIFDYYLKHSTQKIARKIINEIIDEPNKLIENLEIGQIEVMLKGR